MQEHLAEGEPAVGVSSVRRSQFAFCFVGPWVSDWSTACLAGGVGPVAT